MKQKLIRNVLSIALSIFLVMGMMLNSTAEGMGELPASEPTATTSGYAINYDWSWMTVNETKEKTTVINFAGHEWYVVGYNGNPGGVATTSGVITLLSVNEFGEAAKFNNSTIGVQNEYYNSNLRTVLTTRFTGIDERERAVMVSRLLDGVAGEQPTDQLWALSLDEAKSLNQNLRLFVQLWWLRSKAEGTNAGSKIHAAYVNGFTGAVADVGNYVTVPTYRVRPAFNLNLSSVLFSSAAEGGKPVATGQDLSAVTAPGLKAKLTVIDSNTENLNLTVAQDVYSGIEGKTYAPGDTVEITYSGAKTAENKYVSCVITNSYGKVIHYGKLLQAESGTAKFTVPALEDGNYTINLFNEECSADSDKKSDYASKPFEISMTVLDPLPTYTVTLPTGTGYTAIAQSGSSSPVNRDGSYSFKVELAPEYNQSVMTVKANETTLTPDGNGVYTISNIAGNQIITVTGVKKNAIPIATATLNIQKDDSVWNGHGKNFTLKLSTDGNITAQMIGTDGTIEASVPYGTWKIYEDSTYTGMTITVGSTGGIETLNYYTVTFSVVDADASK